VSLENIEIPSLTLIQTFPLPISVPSMSYHTSLVGQPRNIPPNVNKNVAEVDFIIRKFERVIEVADHVSDAGGIWIGPLSLLGCHQYRQGVGVLVRLGTLTK
jgi:hypothetical protein